MPVEPSEFLRQFVADRDVACPQCDYNLRDLQATICPECGQALELRLQLADPRPAAPIAGLVGLAAGLGFNALLLVYFGVVMLLFDHFNGREALRFVGTLSGGFIVFSAAVWWWLRLWRRLRLFKPRRRWWLVASCYILSLIDVFVFVAMIR